MHGSDGRDADNRGYGIEKSPAGCSKKADKSVEIRVHGDAGGRDDGMRQDEARGWQGDGGESCPYY